MSGKRVVMLLSNPFAPDIRPYLEAKALIEGGYDVDLIAWDRSCSLPEGEVVDGIKVHRIRLPSRKGLLFPLRLRKFQSLAVRLARKMDYDIVHAHDLDTLLPAIKLRGKDKRLVYDIHDI